MKLEIDEHYTKTLHVNKESECKCEICHKKAEHIYYCEIKKKIYCSKCLLNGGSCCIEPHTDYKIDQVIKDG